MFPVECVSGSCWLTLIGALTVGHLLYVILRSPVQLIWHSLTASGISLNERYGEWAVITGSSDGIGREYAKNLAKAGMNVMLISRTADKLKSVADEIRAECTAKVKWLAVDFSQGEPVYEKIREAIAEIEVGILVNNVGMVHDHPLPVERICLPEVEQSLSVTILPTVRMCQLVIPEMKRRRRGIIVNVTSAGGALSLPYISLYSASKAFAINFSESLQYELKGTGVECQLVMPLFVNTAMSATWHSLLFWKMLAVDVETYGRSAVRMIGKVDKTTGYWYHAMQFGLVLCAPTWMVNWAADSLIRYLGKFVKTEKGHRN